MRDVSDYELFHHVRQALISATLGDTDEYDQLIGIMHHNTRLVPEDVAMLVTVLRALSGAVSYIDTVHHRSLLSSICRMRLWNYGRDVMDALVEFVINLAASNGKYVDLCLDMLVSNFIPPDNFLEILKQPRGLVIKDQVLIRVHSALKGIADLVPLAPSRLEQIVRERVPGVYAKEAQIVVYVENMLMLESGYMGKFVGDSMIFELVYRLIELDVEIEWGEVLLDDPNSKGIFEMELEDLARPVDETEMDMDELPKEYSGRKVLWGNVAAQKLDTLMDLTFDHLQSCFRSGRLLEVFEVLLHSFQSTVLNTEKSKFTQFVIFYACSLDPKNCGTKFVSRLLEIFRSSKRQDCRMSAISYLASYMSRAKFLSTSDVMIILESLVDWCYKFSRKQSGEINQIHHRVFYAGCQAVMYVLCFRMSSIMATPELKSQLLNMPLEKIFKHALNPLEVCLPSIVEEFLHQAKAAHLFTVSNDAFVFDHLHKSDMPRAFGGFQRLHVFFPFDPYLLKKSDRYIQPNFIYWSMVRTTYEDDDDDDNNDEDDDMSVKDEIDMLGNQKDRRMQMPSRIRPSTSPESL